MTFTRWAFVYLGTEADDPGEQRAVIEHGGLRTTVVAVPTRAAVVDAVVGLVADGAQTVELCGAFGPTDVAAVLAATGGRVPVGAAAYGMESVPRLAALFADET